jgi:hypothetical protein
MSYADLRASMSKPRANFAGVLAAAPNFGGRKVHRDPLSNSRRPQLNLRFGLTAAPDLRD